MWWVAVGAAFAFDNCGPDPLPPIPDTLAVAWVSPRGRRVNKGSYVPLVPTSALRAFVGRISGDPTARTLQWLGLRRSSRPPRRSYKVVVFDATRQELCRPILSDAEQLSGVSVCDPDHAGPDGNYGGCGVLTDLATGQTSAPLYRAQWQVLARDGFCVLPLERFLSETRHDVRTAGAASDPF